VKQYLAQVWAIVRKDLAVERRSRDLLTAMFVYALTVILVFSFSFDLRAERVREVAPGVLWVAITFAGMLGLARSFILERDQGCLDGLLLAPVERSAIFVGKMLANLIFIFLVAAITLPIYLALFDLPFKPLLLAVVLLGTVGYAAVGTLFSAMAVHGRAREVLLPVLLFPVAIPVVIAAVKLTGGLFDGQPWGSIANWFHFLVAFDAIFLTLAILAFDAVLEE
jgi:heme exporter protein B